MTKIKVTSSAHARGVPARNMARQFGVRNLSTRNPSRMPVQMETAHTAGSAEVGMVPCDKQRKSATSEVHTAMTHIRPLSVVALQ